MQKIKENLSLIFQDSSSKKISIIKTASSSSISSLMSLSSTLLVDCDLDSILLIDKFELADQKILTSSEGLSFTGLLPVVAVDEENTVLMQAFLNQEALSETFRTKYANYFSRSRGKIWMKGESSENKQKILKVEYSEQNSFFIYTVKQEIAACHEGFYSCFYRKLEKDGSLIQIDFDRKFQPDKIYGK